MNLGIIHKFYIVVCLYRVMETNDTQISLSKDGATALRKFLLNEPSINSEEFEQIIEVLNL